jgi:hypothetical protein
MEKFVFRGPSGELGRIQVIAVQKNFHALRS